VSDRPQIAFTVTGQPQPKGSARAFMPKGWTRPIITSANPNLKQWEATIKGELQRVMADTPRDVLNELYDAPVSVTLIFRVARPKSLAKRVTEATKKPDLDKLARGAIDALSGVLFRDDAQVVAINARKQYAESAAQLDIVVESWASPLFTLTSGKDANAATV
jgi:Holliday junction resolvase RusA-like endonuclease